jgi:hypothetical protein
MFFYAPINMRSILDLKQRTVETYQKLFAWQAPADVSQLMPQNIQEASSNADDENRVPGLLPGIHNSMQNHLLGLLPITSVHNLKYFIINFACLAPMMQSELVKPISICVTKEIPKQYFYYRSKKLPTECSSHPTPQTY